MCDSHDIISIRVATDDTFRLDPSLLNTLIGQIATLSSVYHKPPEAFVVRRGNGLTGVGDEDDEDDDEDEDDDYAEDRGAAAGGAGGGVDLLDMGGLGISGNDIAGGGSAVCRKVPLLGIQLVETAGGLT